MKIFSTVRDTQRGSQSYMKKRREEGDRGDQEKRGNQKGREQPSPIINSLYALQSPEHSEKFTEFYREGKRKEGDRSDQGETRGKSKGERVT